MGRVSAGTKGANREYDKGDKHGKDGDKLQLPFESRAPARESRERCKLSRRCLKRSLGRKLILKHFCTSETAYGDAVLYFRSLPKTNGETTFPCFPPSTKPLRMVMPFCAVAVYPLAGGLDILGLALNDDQHLLILRSSNHKLRLQQF